MLRAASVGLGWWSDELAAAIQGKSDRIRVASCYSRSADKRAAFAEKFGTAVHDSWGDVLRDPAVDAVILTTPHSLHGSHVAQAAEAGKHVFVEKPFTLTVADGWRAATACESAGVVLAVGHNRRFSAVAAAIRELWDGGAFGQALHLEANFSAPGALGYTPERWRANRIESPAGGIAGLGVHLIDLLAWFAGPVTGVRAKASRRVAPVDIDDVTSALFDFESGATGYLGCIFACPYTSYLNVYGTEANAFAQVDGNELRVQRAGEPAEERPLAPIDTLRAELDEFAAACAGETVYRVRPEEAIATVGVMAAIAESAARGGALVAP